METLVLLGQLALATVCLGWLGKGIASQIDDLRALNGQRRG